MISCSANFFGDVRHDIVFSTVVYNRIPQKLPNEIPVDEPTNEPDREPTNEPINDISMNLLNAIKAAPTASKNDLEKKIGASRATVTRALARLVAAKSIQRIGPNKGGKWKVLTKAMTGRGEK